jgi:hypothetical protein
MLEIKSDAVAVAFARIPYDVERIAAVIAKCGLLSSFAERLGREYSDGFAAKFCIGYHELSCYGDSPHSLDISAVMGIVIIYTEDVTNERCAI